MTYDELQKKTAELYASDEVYTSPDFQCDQTGGFPTSLCVCWEKQKAWLELNDNMITAADGGICSGRKRRRSPKTCEYP